MSNDNGPGFSLNKPGPSSPDEQEPSVASSPPAVPATPWQAGPVAPVPARRGVQPLAHAVSVIGGLVLVPAALLLLDYGARRWSSAMVQYNDSAASGSTVLCVVLALVLLIGVGALGRLSAVGPLVAGVVWGVIPTAIALLRPLELWRRVHDGPHLYNTQGFYLVSAGSLVFPIIAALLIGTAVSGRWTR